MDGENSRRLAARGTCDATRDARRGAREDGAGDERGPGGGGRAGTWPPGDMRGEIGAHRGRDHSMHEK